MDHGVATDSMDRLSKLSGIPKPEMVSIAEHVKANLAALDACPGPHEFAIDATPDRTIGKRWRCAKCGGEVDFGAKLWYEKGLAHGAQK